jgi:hypothetical protein
MKTFKHFEFICCLPRHVTGSSRRVETYIQTPTLSLLNLYAISLIGFLTATYPSPISAAQNLPSDYWKTRTALGHPQKVFIHFAITVFIMKNRNAVIPVGNETEFPGHRLTIRIDLRFAYADAADWHGVNAARRPLSVAFDIMRFIPDQTN